MVSLKGGLNVWLKDRKLPTEKEGTRTLTSEMKWNKEKKVKLYRLLPMNDRLL